MVPIFICHDVSKDKWLYIEVLTRSLHDPPEQYSMMIHKPVPLRYDPWYL